MSDKIQRIKEMENILNHSVKVIQEFENAFHVFKKNEEDASVLFRYYGSKEWFSHLEDYEKGLIPKDIPCGILSEDAVYDLLTDYIRILEEMKEFADNNKICCCDQQVIISQAIEKMTLFYKNNIHDINHFLKVWSYAKTIGKQERLNEDDLLTLELSAIIHDIACPLCREKYGKALGIYQEIEGKTLAEQFLKEFNISLNQYERIVYLISHHHTLDAIEGMDYQILIESDYLVNADEGNISKESIIQFRDQYFKTNTGITLLNSIYDLQEK